MSQFLKTSSTLQHTIPVLIDTQMKLYAQGSSMDPLTLQETLISTIRQLERLKPNFRLSEEAYDLESAVNKLTEQLFSLQSLSSYKGSESDISLSIELLKSLSDKAHHSIEQGIGLDDPRLIINESLRVNIQLSKITLGEMNAY
jgi:hypothetical protein